MSAESSPEALAAENQRLREALPRATTHSATLEARLRDSEAMRRDLEHRIALLTRCVFGSRSEKIGKDVRETLHKLPVQYEVHQHVYPKMACPCCPSGVVMPE